MHNTTLQVREVARLMLKHGKQEKTAAKAPKPRADISAQWRFSLYRPGRAYTVILEGTKTCNGLKVTWPKWYQTCVYNCSF